MGLHRDCTWVLGLSGFRAVTTEESVNGRLVMRIERGIAGPSRAPMPVWTRTQGSKGDPSARLQRA